MNTILIFLVSYNEVISAYTSQAKSKHFKGVSEELNTTTNVLYLALNAFAKLDQHVVDEYIQFSGLKDVSLNWHLSTMMIDFSFLISCLPWYRYQSASRWAH